MFRVLSGHIQACSLQVKSQDAVHTLGSQCVYISDILKPYLVYISEILKPYHGLSISLM